MVRGNKHLSEQIVSLLRQLEGRWGKTSSSASRNGSITRQTYDRWREEGGGLQFNQARRLNELEQENAKLRWFSADLSPVKLVVKDIASGKPSATAEVG